MPNSTLMDRRPKISVITVCLNSEATIAETISSVKNQEFENYEHIIFEAANERKQEFALALSQAIEAASAVA